MRGDATTLAGGRLLTALYSLLLLGTGGDAGAAIPASERAALIALYNSTNGAGWTYRTNWRNAADTDFAPPGTECTWFRVSCDPGETHVAHLDLWNNNLSGPIPPEISSLAGLTALGLGDNRLTGSIPPEIGSLSQLTDLQLYTNQLTGSIPPEIANLANLGSLILGANPLGGSIPPQIGNLTKLWLLDLHADGLTGSIPPEVGNLSRLLQLILFDNQLSGSIPAWIGNLADLRLLDLSGNELTGPIPPETGRLSRLLYLHLQGNQLRGPIPATLASLTLLDISQSDLRWNALYTDDPALRAFLDSKQIGGDWESTQTVAPTGLAAGGATLGSVPVSWSPILYTGDPGGYRLWYGTRAGGPYNLGGTTADKAQSASAVTGLSPGTTYYLALDTVTEPHANNQNTVVSARTPEVSATTTAGGLGWHGLTIERQGPGTVSSSPGGIACGGACSATFAPGTPVVLTAAPDAGSTFLGWGGACAGAASTCDVTMDVSLTVTAFFSPPATSYYTVAPCRVYDSRDADRGGPAALATGDHAIVVARDCGVPTTAKAVSLNVTVVTPSQGGHLRLFASGTSRPATSSINYASGQTRANNAVVSLGADGALIVYVNQPSGTVHVVLDVDGYFQ
jgi:hypothetical protein